MQIQRPRPVDVCLCSKQRHIITRHSLGKHIAFSQCFGAFGVGLNTATFTPATNLASTANIISVAASTYTDAAGNNGGAAETAKFSIDTTVPTVTVKMDKTALKGGDTSVVTFTFSQVTTDFALTDVDMTGAQGALSNPVQVGGAGSKVWTATFTPTAQIEDGTNIIKVTAGTFNVKATITDGTLGNTGPEATDSARFDLSNLNPVSPSTKQGVGIRIDTDRDNNGAGDGILNTAEINGGTTASVTVTLPSDAKAGDVLVITGTGNDAKSITLSDAQILAGSITTTFSLPANGIELKVTAQVTDAAGNTSNLATDTATVNTTPVGSPIVEITTDKDNSGFINRVELGSATTISVKTTLPTTTSTTAGASVGDIITVTDGTNTQKHKLTQADITAGFVTDTFAKPAEGGTINVSATLTNTAGNISQPGTDSAVLDTSSFVDPTDPTKSGLKVIIDTDTNNDGTISGAELTATFKATVTLPAQAAAGDTLTLNASGNNPRTITLTAADIAAGKVEVSGLTPTGNGTTFTVSASLVDRAGNASPTPDASDSAVIKTSAPNGGVAPTVEITTDANNDGVVNATELNGANTFSVKGSFDKTKVVAGDQMVFTDGTNTQTVTLTPSKAASTKPKWSQATNSSSPLAA